MFAFKTFALQIQELDPPEYQGQTFSVDLGTVEEAMKIEQRIEEGDLVTSDNIVMEVVMDATASLQLPEDLLESLDSCNFTTNLTSAKPQRLSYSVFLSDVLFQNFNQSHSKIGSIIVAARLTCADNTTLNTSIENTFQINREVRFEDVIGHANLLHCFSGCTSQKNYVGRWLLVFNLLLFEVIMQEMM